MKDIPFITRDITKLFVLPKIYMFSICFHFFPVSFKYESEKPKVQKLTSFGTEVFLTKILSLINISSCFAETIDLVRNSLF